MSLRRCSPSAAVELELDQLGEGGGPSGTRSAGWSLRAGSPATSTRPAWWNARCRGGAAGSGGDFERRHNAAHQELALEPYGIHSAAIAAVLVLPDRGRADVPHVSQAVLR